MSLTRELIDQEALMVQGGERGVISFLKKILEKFVGLKQNAYFCRRFGT